jgi:Flavodoxin domain
MRVAIVYESMYGNTRQIAEAIALGVTQIVASAAVEVVPVHEAAASLAADADLMIVGGPTHAWSMSRPRTRNAAVDAAGRPGSCVNVEPDAGGSGMREWLSTLDAVPAAVAAFDTRRKGPAALTGRASVAISRALTRRGAHGAITSQSFLVTTKDQLVDGERQRAQNWGQDIARRLLQQQVN